MSGQKAMEDKRPGAETMAEKMPSAADPKTTRKENKKKERYVPRQFRKRTTALMYHQYVDCAQHHVQWMRANGQRGLCALEASKGQATVNQKVLPTKQTTTTTQRLACAPGGLESKHSVRKSPYGLVFEARSLSQARSVTFGSADKVVAASRGRPSTVPRSS